MFFSVGVQGQITGVTGVERVLGEVFVLRMVILPRLLSLPVSFAVYFEYSPHFFGSSFPFCKYRLSLSGMISLSKFWDLGGSGHGPPCLRLLLSFRRHITLPMEGNHASSAL